MTAGGENVAPILIEEKVKEKLPFVSNVMIIGEGRKYLIALLTIKTSGLASEAPVHTLSQDCKEILKKFEITDMNTVQNCMSSV